MLDIIITKSAKRRSSVLLRGIGENKVEMRIPQRYSPEMIAEVISRHTKFLHRAKATSHPIIPGILGSGMKVHLFGNEYTITILKVPRRSSITALVDKRLGTIIIQSRKETITKKEFYDSVTEYLIDYLERSTRAHATRMGDLKYGRIRTKTVRSLWGSCSSTGNLSFNKRLIHYPEKAIDYVVIHELAHLVHRNHSQRFWDLVEKYDPTFQDSRKMLKGNKYG